jgi:hypothetical protein
VDKPGYFVASYHHLKHNNSHVQNLKEGLQNKLVFKSHNGNSQKYQPTEGGIQVDNSLLRRCLREPLCVLHWVARIVRVYFEWCLDSICPMCVISEFARIPLSAQDLPISIQNLLNLDKKYVPMKARLF